MDDKAKGGKRAGIGILIIACLVMAVFVVQYLAASDTKNISKASKIGYISLSKVMSVNKGSEYCTVTAGDLLVPKIGTLFTLVGVTSKEIK